MMFDTQYRMGRPVWQSDVQPEMRYVIERPDALSPGLALDVGCGTAHNVTYLAQHGWRATGVDFSTAAIRRATRDDHDVPAARILVGDVTMLTRLDIATPIDLVLDMGWYHSLPEDAKPRYVRELADLLAPGTPLMMWQGVRLRAGEIAEAFCAPFIMERTQCKDFTVQRHMLRHNITAHWYWLRRR